MIMDNSDIWTDPTEIADSMNAFYTHVADQIRDDNSQPKAKDSSTIDAFVETAGPYHISQPWVQEIKARHSKASECFTFRPVNCDEVQNVIDSLDAREATGEDFIPTKDLKIARGINAPQLASLFNSCVSSSKFPHGAKLAEVIPVYKKGDALLRKNHRPVSLLTCTSKILENLMGAQLNDCFLKNVYNESLSAFRAGYSCQQVLLYLAQCLKISGLNSYG